MKEAEYCLKFLTLSVAFNTQTLFPYPYTGVPPDIFGGLFASSEVGYITTSDSLAIYPVSEPSLVINSLLHILYVLCAYLS